jgi:hypothetical protein
MVVWYHQVVGGMVVQCVKNKCVRTSTKKRAIELVLFAVLFFEYTLGKS